MNESRMVRWSIFGCAVIAAGSIVLSLVFASALTRQINEIKSARTSGRAQTCVSFNEIIDPINNIIVTFAMPRAGTQRTPTEQATVNAQVAKILLQRRVCTPDGIAAYVNGDKANAYEPPPQAKQLIGVTP